MIEVPVGGAVPRFELTSWRQDYGIVAGITLAGDPTTPFDMGLAGSEQAGPALERWEALRRAVPGFRGIVVGRQVHGTMVLWHEDARGVAVFDGVDGHATSSPGIFLAVTAADCVPVYIIDPVRRFSALVHAGWRGTAGGILSAGLALLQARGSIVDNVSIHCGIGICGECYEVSREVFEACGVPAPAAGKGPLDLREVLVRQARDLGVESISTSQFCSSHDGGFFSHRGSGGRPGRMAAYLGLIP